jgi:hypothetical protein
MRQFGLNTEITTKREPFQAKPPQNKGTPKLRHLGFSDIIRSEREVVLYSEQIKEDGISRWLMASRPLHNLEKTIIAATQ